MDILNEIVAHKRKEIEEFRQYVPVDMLYGLVEPLLPQPVASLREALMQSATGIIAEFKRKSPSKGWIRREAKADEVTLSYAANGASALSILTDSHYFGGYDEYVQIARAAGVRIPILYKNFVIDTYQLLHARRCGASAVLLIAAALCKDEARTLCEAAHEIGLEVLLEMHDERDLDYADIGPDLYGINNRNLGSFVTHVSNSFRLAELLPKEVCKVSESGISDPQTVAELRRMGFRGFLIGEHFMQLQDPGMALRRFVEALHEHETNR